MRKFVFALLLVAAACGNKGTETVYSPQSQGPEPAKLVSSAVELKTEADKNKVIASGGVLLGRDQQRATTYWQSDVALARFAVYRVEKDQWPKLDAQFQPAR